VAENSYSILGTMQAPDSVLASHMVTPLTGVPLHKVCDEITSVGSAHFAFTQ